MSRASLHFQRGAECLRSRQFSQALQWAEDGLVGNADDGHLLQILGLAHWSRKNVEAALHALETANALVPLDPLAQFALAEIYRERKFAGAAYTIYRHLLERTDIPFEMLPRIAQGLGGLGKHRQALATCRRILKKEPDHHGALFGVSVYLSHLHADWDRIRESAGIAFALAPDKIDYRIQFAWSCLKCGLIEKAYGLICAVSPSALHCVCWIRKLLEIAEASGDRELGEMCWQRLQTIDPCR